MKMDFEIIINRKVSGADLNIKKYSFSIFTNIHKTLHKKNKIQT